MENWIPRTCIKDILSSVEAMDGSTHVFYIEGEGGTGKTILLRQIGKNLGSPDGVTGCFPWSGIIDLFHSELNTNSGLEDCLAKAFGRKGEFQEYYGARQSYKERRDAGEYGSEIEQERLGLSRIFANCLNKVSNTRRLIIVLDTIEQIQYEVDEVQVLCHLERENTSVRMWLIDQLGQWKNCVVLLAGRPNEGNKEVKFLLENMAREAVIKYHPIDLGGFDKSETQDYFILQDEQHPVVKGFDPTFKYLLWQVTDGKPIRLDLAIYVSEHELGAELNEIWLQIRSKPVKEAQDLLDRLLIEHVMQNDPEPIPRMVLRYLAIARNGIDASQLRHLEQDWSLEDCQKYLDAVASRFFIKPRPGDKRLFLHDQMYELCDWYLLSADEVQELSGKLIIWYDEQIRSAKSDKERKDHQVESLLYRLRVDPREGYYWYAITVDEAIRYGEVGFDMRMRNELLSFLRSTSPIDRKILRQAPDLRDEIDGDCVARWIKRFISRGLYDKATSVGNVLKEASNQFIRPNLPNARLAQADADIYYAQALIYTGAGVDEGISLLKKHILDLEGQQKPDDLAWQGNPHEYISWRRNLVLGRGHNNLGYAYWIEKFHYSLALPEFSAAVPYFRASDMYEENATTYDNRGRIFALLYDRGRAEALLNDSLALRQKLERSYRIGLSLNSRAICCLTFEQPHRAHQLAKEALEIFYDLGALRGIGLASITLGRSLRLLGILGASGLYPPGETEGFFRQSEERLERAIDIFSERIHEPVRLIEAYNELGCTYRDWAAKAVKENRSVARYVQNAIHNLEESIRLAEASHPVLFVDSCDDLAHVFFQMEDFEQTETWLNKADDHIPSAYKLREGGSIPEINEEERVEEYFRMLGKIELARGYTSFDRGVQRGDGRLPREDLVYSIIHFALAAQYFELFSSQAIGLDKTYNELYERYKKCKHDDLQFLLEVVIPDTTLHYGLSVNCSKWLNKFFEDTLAA
jgi:hypothetical protein